MASDISDWFFRYSRCCWRRNIGQVQASQNLKGKKNDLDFKNKIKKIKKEAEEYFFDPATTLADFGIFIQTFDPVTIYSFSYFVASLPGGYEVPLHLPSVVWMADKHIGVG